MNYLSFGLTAIIILLIAFFGILPPFIDWQSNRVLSSEKAKISDQAINLHKKLFIGDWHADSTLWSRDLSLRHSRGHLDIPRMQQGNIAPVATRSSPPPTPRPKWPNKSNLTKLSMEQIRNIRTNGHWLTD